MCVRERESLELRLTGVLLASKRQDCYQERARKRGVTVILNVVAFRENQSHGHKHEITVAEKLGYIACEARTNMQKHEKTRRQTRRASAFMLTTMLLWQ